MKIILATLTLLSTAAPAFAQYYAPPPPPPPGYYPPPPPPGYYRPEYERPRIGRHCRVVFRTPYGPRENFCPIVDPKPMGEECACPTPPPGPGYPPGPYVGGVTVR